MGGRGSRRAVEAEKSRPCLKTSTRPTASREPRTLVQGDRHSNDYNWNQPRLTHTARQNEKNADLPTNRRAGGFQRQTASLFGRRNMTTWRKLLLFELALLAGIAAGLVFWLLKYQHQSRSPEAPSVPQAGAAANQPMLGPTPTAPTLEQLCRQEAQKLSRRLPSGCHTLVHPPFVVAGNLSPEQLQGWLDRTLLPAYRAMRRSYLKRLPDHPVTVLLFADEASYRRGAEKLFADRNVSPYGYYKPSQRTLVMNIATGGGTLVHELTHALLHFDFPEVPDWFNEGLGSLHEQCRFLPDGSGIQGLVNWRLPALQTAIRRGDLRPLRELVTAPDFRTRSVGLNYAQARYFCMYLQEKGVLQRFYRQFRDHVQQDPTGGRFVM